MRIRTIKGVKYLVSGGRDLLFYRRSGQLSAYRITEGHCSCPATRKCKHMADAVEVRSDLLVEELKALVDEPLTTIWSMICQSASEVRNT